MRLGARAKARAFYAEAYPNWGTGALALYEAAHLSWGHPAPLADEVRPALPRASDGVVYPEVARVRAGWCESMYGAASAVMREVYDRLEAQWCRCVDDAARVRVDKQLPVLMNRPEQLNAVDPPDTAGGMWRIEQFAERIDAALGLAGGVARTRVEYFRQAFEVTRALAVASRPVRVAQAALASAGASTRLTAAQFNAPSFAAGRAALEELNRRIVGVDAYRENVRDPVHQALARADVAQLGAPVSGVLWMRELTAVSPTSVFSYADVMFERASLLRYFDWWRQVVRGAGVTDGAEDHGFRAILFRLKEVVTEIARALADGAIRWDGTALNADGPFDAVRFQYVDDGRREFIGLTREGVSYVEKA